MPEVTVTLEDVESKDVNTRRGLSTVYRLKASDGRTYTTFDDKLAKEGAKYRGQTVVLDYVESQNGEYTNYNLNGVKAGEQEFAQNRPDPQLAPGFNPGDSVTSKDTSIARAVALKAAVTYVVAGISPEDDVITLADSWVAWLLTGSTLPEGAFPF